MHFSKDYAHLCFVLLVKHFLGYFFQMAQQWLCYYCNQITQPHTNFSGNKAAYPVYLTIGNIPRATRRKPSKHSMCPQAYLQSTKLIVPAWMIRNIVLEYNVYSTSRWECPGASYHSWYQWCGNDQFRWELFIVGSNPILTCLLLTITEQWPLVACTKYGTMCKCQALCQWTFKTQTSPPIDPSWTQEYYCAEYGGVRCNAKKFSPYCMSKMLLAVFKAFLVGFPSAIFHRLLHDVLHQLYQEFKHVVSWCKKILTPQALNRHFVHFHPHMTVDNSTNGISALSQYPAQERKKTC